MTAASLIMVLAACGQATPTPTLPPAPEPTDTTVAETLPTALPSATSMPTPTATEAVAEPPTPTAPLAPTETPSPAATATSTLTPTATARPASEPIAPGQRDIGELGPGEVAFYPYEGVRFESVMIFADGDAEMDPALAVYPGSVTSEAGLEGLAPLTEVNASGAGRPEILVFSADADGAYTIAISNEADMTGAYSLYLFDGTTEAPDVTLQSGSLTAGQSASVSVTSNGGRPVVIYADPTDRSNLVVVVRDENGNLVTEANFSGPGSPEAIYLLPLRTTTYVIQILEANGAAATYDLAIATLS